jgi:hypothetical protein
MDWSPELIHAAGDASLNNPAPQLNNTRTPNAPSETAGLNLRVDPRGSDAFELSWNPQCPTIQDAISGSLSINDDRHLSRFVHLNAEDLHSGRLMYMTGSPDVTFHFKVMDLAGNNTVQSFRVLKDAAESEGVLTAALNLGLFPGSQAPLSPIQKIQDEVAAPASPVSFHVTEPPQLLSNPVVLPNGGAHLTVTPFAPETPIQVDSVPPPAALPSAPASVPDRSSPAATPPRVLFQYVPRLPGHSGRPLDVFVPVVVQISNSGTILATTLATPDKTIPVEFIHSALDAARRWQFAPATLHGTPVVSSMTLRFHFSTK